MHPWRRIRQHVATKTSVARSREAVAGRSLDEASPGEDYTLRWIYLHMIEEYARFRPLDHERSALEDRLDYQRSTLLLKCGGLTPEQLTLRSVPPSTLSLLGLVRHLSGVEAWFHSYDGQPDHMYFWDYVPGSTEGCDEVDITRAADDLASYKASVARSREAVAGRSLDEASPGEDYTLRWIYLHMIEEYARHNGHADLLRERIDGATGE